MTDLNATEKAVAELRRAILCLRLEVNDRIADDIAAKVEPVITALRQAGKMREALLWAYGMGDDFPDRQPGEGAFWWRSELADRAPFLIEEVIARRNARHAARKTEVK